MAQAQQVVQQRGEFFLTEEEQAMVSKITAQLIGENAGKHELKGFFLDEEADNLYERRERMKKKHIQLKKAHLRAVRMHTVIGGFFGLIAGVAFGLDRSIGMSWFGTGATVVLFAIVGTAIGGVIGWIVANVSAECRHENRK